MSPSMMGITVPDLDFTFPALDAAVFRKPTQGKTLAVMDVSGGSQPFSA